MNSILKFKDFLKDSVQIVITTHIQPDADGIGSMLALNYALCLLGKKVTCVLEETIPRKLKYLDYDELIYSYSQYIKNHKQNEIDLLIVVDTNSLTRVGNKIQELGIDSHKILYIDHHPCSKEVQTIHLIDIEKCATAEIIGSLIEGLGIDFVPQMALPLYSAIMVDSSSFRYPNVTAETHRMIARIMDTGGLTPSEAYDHMYGKKRISYMQLLGKILASAKISSNKSIAWITMKESELKTYEINVDDTYGFVNHLLVLDNIKIACMFREHGQYVKVSLRSARDIDVGAMAHALGGGGHNHSAATTIKGEIRRVVPRTIFQLTVMMDNLSSKTK